MIIWPTNHRPSPTWLSAHSFFSFQTRARCALSNTHTHTACHLLFVSLSKCSLSVINNALADVVCVPKHRDKLKVCQQAAVGVRKLRRRCLLCASWSFSIELCKLEQNRERERKSHSLLRCNKLSAQATTDKSGTLLYFILFNAANEAAAAAVARRRKVKLNLLALRSEKTRPEKHTLTHTQWDLHAFCSLAGGAHTFLGPLKHCAI